MPSAAALAAALASNGRSMTLTRITTGSTGASVTVQGFDRGNAPVQLAGNQAQGLRRIVIGNAEIAAAAWPGPPVRGDQLTIGTDVLTIEAVETIAWRCQTLRHNLTVEG